MSATSFFFFFNAALVCPFSPIVSGMNAQVSSFTSAFRPQLTVPESVVAKTYKQPGSTTDGLSYITCFAFFSLGR